MLEECICHNFAEWKPLYEPLGPESTLKKRVVGTFYKTDKKIFICMSFSMQKMCLSETSGPDIFSHVNQIVSRMNAESRVKKGTTIHRKL